MTEIEKKLGYAFKDSRLLERALTTPACKMSNPSAHDNQRLEFLGDAVIGLLSAATVFRAYPDDQEGMLTVRRTHLVSGKALIDAAEKFGLRKYLKLNAGAHELQKGAKVLADAVEALMGAVWLDGGFEAAERVFKNFDLPFEEDLNEWDSNPKGYLQVLAQGLKPSQVPEYKVDMVRGAQHEPVVTVTVRVKNLGSATATAVSRRRAEVEAAAKLLENVKGVKQC